MHHINVYSLFTNIQVDCLSTLNETYSYQSYSALIRHNNNTHQKIKEGTGDFLKTFIDHSIGRIDLEEDYYESY